MLVSAIIPTYNREGTIERAINSVLAQTYADLEIIVVDDGSTDGTVDCLGKFGSRVKILQQANRGPSAARNAGVALSRGEILAFLDSDDEWHPEKIEKQVELLEQWGERMVCCVCNAELHGLLGGKAHTSFARACLWPGTESGCWSNPSRVLATRFLLFNQVVAVRREFLQRTGGFREDLHLLEDHDLAFRLSLLGPWGFIRTPLVVKHNDPEGIGVKAMQDHLAHAFARKKLLEGFLSGTTPLDEGTRRLLTDSLSEVKEEISARQWADHPGRTRSALGRLWQLGLRVRGGIRRRSSSWPRLEAERLPAALDTVRSPVPA